jgi:predicted RND superfamily exporter protein
MKSNIRNSIIAVFSVLTVVSAILILGLKFSFDFEQFFPKGDPDLEFFKEFSANFEADDNFTLVAVENHPSVFDSVFLAKFHELTERADTLPYVTGTQSITTFQFPIVRPPFFTMNVPAIHMNDPSRYEADKEALLKDDLLANNLISKNGTALVLFIKNKNALGQEEAEEFMPILSELVEEYEFDDYHFLGRANFQQELVYMQKRELAVSIIISIILTAIILTILFQKFWGVFIAMTSIGMSLLLFGGVMSALGRELTALSALYPVLMSIVATSDVIHLMSKYIDELRKGFSKDEAIRTTIRQIGIATLLTSVTTAVGFASLATSRVPPIKEFGWSAAIGVMVAYVTVLLLASAMLSLFRADQITKIKEGKSIWEKFMQWFYDYTKLKPRFIGIVASVLAIICIFGITLITTNYKLENNLPLGRKVTKDYLYFEKELAGFRPFEIAVMMQGDYTADDYEVVKEIDKLEQFMAKFGNIQNISSITSLYKGIRRAHNANNLEAYKFPDTEAEFDKYQRFAKRMPPQTLNVLVSTDKKNVRVSAKVLDIGADNIKDYVTEIDDYAAANIDPAIIKIRQTGTSLMMDKNSKYIRESLLKGLMIAIVIVSILMAILFQNWKMVIISLIPNMFPLLLAGALLGYLGIELEAGVSVIFAIIFGIAVDDTIHFLSKFRLARSEGLSIDDAIHITFIETGKAITLTTIILFFGFLVLFFSINPPSLVIGGMISITLVSALFGDLFLIPILIRWLMNEED